MEEKISVIIVNYNGKQYNDTCISSVLESSVRERIQVVVVDNGSTDGSYEELLERWGNHKQVHVIAMNQNAGFSAANNAGIVWSVQHNIHTFLLLNNDTEIEPYAIEKMWECQRKNGGMITPKILYADRRKKIWSAGGTFSAIIQKASHRGINQEDVGQYDKDEKVSFANGCAMFLSKEVTDKIGLLDEGYFLYYEDTEFSIRANENKIPIWYCSDAVIYHKVNGSTKGNEKKDNAYYITRNWLVCNKRHLGRRFPLFLLYFILNRACWIFIWLCTGKPGLVSAVLEGVTDYRRGKMGKYTEENS